MVKDVHEKQEIEILGSEVVCRTACFVAKSDIFVHENIEY